MISRPVSDLADADRRTLENLLGHELEASQQVFVMVFSPGQVPDRATRQAAAERIRRTLDEVDRHRAAQGVTDEEVDAAVDEAMVHVRPHSG